MKGIPNLISAYLPNLKNLVLRKYVVNISFVVVAQQLAAENIKGGVIS